METRLQLYNSLSRQKEVFEPYHPPYVGMYVCGPTVYGDPHLGHARAAIVFDILFRYLIHLGFKVRYVRNITDVGHLENDADEGEDKIGKKARLEQLEPMEIAHQYTVSYQQSIKKLNTLTPSIEPIASGHIPEQIEVIEKILEKGYAYNSNGNLYFDLLRYAGNYSYGKLSGKVIDDLLNTTRELSGQDEKKNPVDFALWKNASKEHIMQWKSPWGNGFPGWHLECTAMSAKYLGLPFDIHGGGLDLMFPHHESEIAQSVVAFGKAPCKYWIHNNLITINGQKMSKSLGNFITLEELFAGNHEALSKAYDPMVLRFFILQAHYRSTIDFSDEALQAAEKGFSRLTQSYKLFSRIASSEKSSVDIQKWINGCYEVMNDDINTARLIAELFEGCRLINLVNDGKETISHDDLLIFSSTFTSFVCDVLGLNLNQDAQDNNKMDGLMQLLIEIRQQSRLNKDFATSDLIRNKLTEIGIQIKDTKDGAEWQIIQI
jgi:cysteinyl-tRNA synthetase